MTEKENKNSSSTRKFFWYLIIIWGIFLLQGFFGEGLIDQAPLIQIFLHISFIFISSIMSFILSRDPVSSRNPVGSKDHHRGDVGKEARMETSELTESTEIKGEKKKYSAGYWAFVTIMGLYILMVLIVWTSEGFKLDDLFSFVGSGIVIACALRVIYFIFALIYRRITGTKARGNRKKEEVKTENGKTDEIDSNKEPSGGSPAIPHKIGGKGEFSYTEGKADGKVNSEFNEGFEGKRLGEVEDYWGFPSSEGGFAKVKFNKDIKRGHKVRIFGENSDFTQSLKIIKQHGEEINKIASGEEYNIEVESEVSIGDIVKSEEIPSCSNEEEAKKDNDEKTGRVTDSKEPSGINNGKVKNGGLEKLNEKKRILLLNICALIRNEIKRKKEAKKKLSTKEDRKPKYRSITPRDLNSSATNKNIINVEESSEATERENEENEREVVNREQLDVGIMPSSLEDSSGPSKETPGKNTDSSDRKSKKTDIENGPKQAKPESVNYPDEVSSPEGINYKIVKRQNRKDFDKTALDGDKKISYVAGIDYSVVGSDKSICRFPQETLHAIDCFEQNVPNEDLIETERTKDSTQQYYYQKSLSLYTNQIETEVLDRKREQALAQKIERGSKKAKKELARHNLRLVISRVKRFRGSGLPFVDLIQEGNLGLMKAIERFDYRKGTKFSTYGVHWIEQRIRRALNNHSRLVRLPAHIISTQRKALRIKRRVKNKGGNITNKEIADELETSKSKVKKALAHRSTYVTLDETKKVKSFYCGKKFFSKIGFEDSTLRQKLIRSLRSSFEGNRGQERKSKLSQLVPSKHTYDSELKSRKEGQKEKLFRMMHEKLTERERRIVILRVGLKENEAKTLEEVGKIFGISRERVRQLQNRAIENLQDLLDREELNRFVRNPKKFDWKYSHTRKFKKMLLDMV